MQIRLTGNRSPTIFITNSRLIKGEGEIVEEAVSYEKHKAINKVYIYNKKYNKVGIMTIIWSIYIQYILKTF